MQQNRSRQTSDKVIIFKKALGKVLLKVCSYLMTDSQPFAASFIAIVKKKKKKLVKERVKGGDTVTWPDFTGHLLIKRLEKTWRCRRLRVLWSRFVIPPDDELSYVFTAFVLCLRWAGTCQPRSLLSVNACHASLLYFTSHPCLVIVVRLMASAASQRSWPCPVEWDLFWFSCLRFAICIHLFCVGVYGFVRLMRGTDRDGRFLPASVCEICPSSACHQRAELWSNILMEWLHWNEAFSH